MTPRLAPTGLGLLTCAHYRLSRERAEPPPGNQVSWKALDKPSMEGICCDVLPGDPRYRAPDEDLARWANKIVDKIRAFR
jgi:hypothetical protein